MASIIHQIESELRNCPAGYYTREQVDNLLDRLEQEYNDHLDELQKMILHKDLQIDALKKENDLIWKSYVDRVAELMIKKRLDS